MVAGVVRTLIASGGDRMRQRGETDGHKRHRHVEQHLKHMTDLKRTLRGVPVPRHFPSFFCECPKGSLTAIWCHGPRDQHGQVVASLHVP